MTVDQMTEGQTYEVTVRRFGGTEVTYIGPFMGVRDNPHSTNKCVQIGQESGVPVFIDISRVESVEAA